MQNLIVTQNLNKIYGAGQVSINALRDINLTVPTGQFLSVVGASGSGKSTLLHLIGGVDRPTSGRVIVDGEDLYSLREKQLSIFRRRQVGFVFQFYNLVPVLTARENITLPILMDGRKVDDAYINELVDLLGIADHQDRLPSQLSGGQQQRVSIARALAARPSVVLADEPTGNLDSANGREVMALLRLSAKKFGQTLILVTHDENLAAQADRIIVIKDGIIDRDEVMSA